MSQKSLTAKELRNAITSEDFLGKDIIDLDGKFVGVTEKVFIDSEKLEFIGVSIDKGFLGKALTIGKDYIERVTENAIFLNMRIAFEIKGLEVFDINGKSVGNVKDLELVENKNQIKSIVVKTNELFSKELKISYEMIDRIGYSVFLKIKKEDLIGGLSKNKR